MWTSGPFLPVLDPCLTAIGPWLISRSFVAHLWFFYGPFLNVGVQLLGHCWTVLDSWVILSLDFHLELFVSLLCSEGPEWVVSLEISAGFIGWKFEFVGNWEKWKIHPVQVTSRANHWWQRFVCAGV